MQTEFEKMPLPDAFVVMYSVIDKASFQRAEEYLARLHDQDLLRGRPAILVGNKVDLVRSRVVSPQGKWRNIYLFFHIYIFSQLGGFVAVTLYGISNSGIKIKLPSLWHSHLFGMIIFFGDVKINFLYNQIYSMLSL